MSRLLAVIALAVGSAPAHAGQATCSNPGLPVGATASSELWPGQLVLGLTAGVLPIRGEELLPDEMVRYDARLVLVETRLAGEYTLLPWLAVGAALPYRVVDIAVTYRDPSTGAEVAPGHAAIHARTETLRGFGDPSLHAHVARDLAGVRLHGRAGTSLPLGRTEEDPFALGSIGQEHEHVQFGSGTLIPFVAFEAQRSIANVTVAAWALAHLSLYENAQNFRASHRLSGGVTGSSSLGTRTWSFGLGAELHAETAEYWKGVVHADEGNGGRRDLYVGASTAWRPLPDLAIVADVKVPVYSHVVGSQLDYNVVVGLGVVKTFDFAARTSWRGLDHAVAGGAGTAPPMPPIAGKLVVYDLWATWCPPCRDLDGKLAALARRYPERLAVRTLDVVDPDSPAWTRYLAPGTFELPHIKLVREDGSIVFERTAPPDELIRAVEAALQGSVQVPR